ncbi:MAG: hypothetical protein WC526_04205 [Patescibacteria group bacterium]
MSSLLDQSIIKTLSYFDIFGYPLTKEELFEFLWQGPGTGEGIHISYEEFLKNLENIDKEKIKYQGGYYFLAGKEANVYKRNEGLLVSSEKLKIARRAAKKIRSVPFLKAVFVCNSVAFGQAGEGSDIDFFIITEKNRIWLVRLFAAFLLSLFRLRRVGDKAKNKVCLSFFAADDNLDLSPLKIVDEDIYLVYWIHKLIPIYDPENYYQKFLDANRWTEKFLPNTFRVKPASYLFAVRDSAFGRIWKKMWQAMWQGDYGKLIETQAKKIQLAKMKFSGKDIERKGDKGVVISDSMLKFHEQDARERFRGEWLKKIYASQNQ